MVLFILIMIFLALWAIQQQLYELVKMKKKEKEVKEHYWAPDED